MTHDPWTDERTAKVARLIKSLYSVVKELEEEFIDEDRKFTLDGHLVGSIGEVVAAYSFGLTLYRSSMQGHDAEAIDGRRVQIKLTGGKKGVALSSQPDFLIVMQLHNYKFNLIYNGPGETVWAECGGVQSNIRQRPISLNKLQALNAVVLDASRIAIQRALPDLGRSNIDIR